VASYLDCHAERDRGAFALDGHRYRYAALRRYTMPILNACDGEKRTEHASISEDAGLELMSFCHLALFVFNMHRIAPSRPAPSFPSPSRIPLLSTRLITFTMMQWVFSAYFNITARWPRLPGLCLTLAYH